MTEQKAQFGTWVSGSHKGYSFNAKIFDVGSDYGINGGRVSILSIRKGNTEIYSYSRGLDFDNCPARILAQIVAQLEKSQ